MKLWIWVVVILVLVLAIIIGISVVRKKNKKGKLEELRPPESGTLRLPPYGRSMAIHGPEDALTWCKKRENEYQALDRSDGQAVQDFWTNLYASRKFTLND